MNGRALRVLWVAVFVAALVCGGGWYRASLLLQQADARPLAGLLEPAAAMLKENEALVKELEAEPFIEKDAGILGSYLAKIRRDGVPRHAQMKQRLDQLAANNQAISVLLSAYAPHATTPAFRAAAIKFSNYNSAWRDRWNSVMELLMAGGNYAVQEPYYPRELQQVLREEIAASPR